MSFIGIHITCSIEIGEMLTAELSLLPFDTFEYHEYGISAYCLEEKFIQSDIEQIIKRYTVKDKIKYSIKREEKINWNKEWEKNFEPVVIDNKILIKAVFHRIDKKYPYEILINPKMSFGTGHHATTHLMLKQQLKNDHKNKSVADFGTGTGILSIMASKLGAKRILATDVDDWCIDNCKENLELNQVEASVLKGKVSELDLETQFEIILANINRNILIDEMSYYKMLLTKNGLLLLSGFYETDIESIKSAANELDLRYQNNSILDGWAVVQLIK